MIRKSWNYFWGALFNNHSLKIILFAFVLLSALYLPRRVLRSYPIKHFKEQKANDFLLKHEHITTGSDEQNPLTIVTAFYILGSRSKHSVGDYVSWTANFFPNIQTPIVAFTSPNLTQNISEWRAGKRGIVISLELANIPPLLKHKELYAKQNSIDPEKTIHYLELYLIWNAKGWFLSQIAELNPYNSKYFFWVDAGSFRNYYGLAYWPGIFRIEQIFGNNKDTVLLGLISCPVVSNISDFQESDGPLVQDMIQGGFFGSSAYGVKWWASEYYRLHDVYITSGKFVGKEQNLMNTLALLHKDKVKLIDTRQSCYDPWFFFQPFTASEEENGLDFNKCQNGNRASTKSLSEACPM
jgi:hypothetical protein